MADIDVVGEAESGADVITKADQLGPDVILMDIQMPGINGIQATRQIVNKHPAIGVIVVTMFEREVVAHLRKKGVRPREIDGAGHLPTLEKPGKINAALRRWLEDIDNE